MKIFEISLLRTVLKHGHFILKYTVGLYSNMLSTLKVGVGTKFEFVTSLVCS